MNNMDLSIITVNTNDKETILTQIKSVFDATHEIEFEHIVSDNGSTDGSIEEIQKQFPQVTIVKNGSNVGFGAANNAALKHATGTYILFLNPDMRVVKGSLEKAVAYMNEHEDVGLMSCKLLDEHGKLHLQAKPRRFPGLIDQLTIVLKVSKVFPSLLHSYLYKKFDADEEQEVDSVRGSFMLTRASIIDTLGWAFDPRYYIWFEDVDTCREVKKLGYKVMYVPSITCTDYVGQTFKRLPSVQKQKWFTESMVKYFKKWEPWYKWIPLVIARPVGIALTWVHSKIVK